MGVSRYPLVGVGVFWRDNSLVLLECNVFVEPWRKACYAGFESWLGRELLGGGAGACLYFLSASPGEKVWSRRPDKL